MKAELVQSFVRLEQAIVKERGECALFALFAREDLPDRWDLVIAAPWITSQKEGAEFVVSEIKQSMGAVVLTDLSRIVFVKPSDAPVVAINKAIQVKHSVVEVKDSDFFGLPIRHAFIITSQALTAPLTK